MITRRGWPRSPAGPRSPEASIPASRDASRPRTAHWWALAWIITAALLAATHYGSGDPDSKLYAGISARLVDEPLTRWIAPEWWGFWGLTGPYHEHPVGMFVVPAALARAGYPALQAAYAINALYQVLSFALVALIARAVLPRREADALAWMLQLLPIAFVFRIRANQEYAVLAGLLFAVYACERARTRPAWIAGMLGGFAAVLLVKGVFAFMVPLACALWLLARGRVTAAEQNLSPARDGHDVEQNFRSARHEYDVEQNFSSAPQRAERYAETEQGFGPARQPVGGWVGVLLMPVAGAAIAWAYELAYFHVTGRSFLEIYRARQVPDGALTSGSPIARTTYTLVWYLARVIWYAFPWSLFACAATWTAPRATRVRRRTPDPGPPDAGSRPTAHGSRPDPDDGRQGAWFAAALTIALVVAFSLAHRKADRYIFPAYFSAAALGGVYVMRRAPAFARIVDCLDRPWVPAVLYVVLVLLRLVTRGALPEFTFWRS